MSESETSAKVIKQNYKTVLVNTKDLKPDPQNPNVMSARQLKSLKYSMEKFDDIHPIVVDAKTMIIADGHHRWRVYLDQGVQKIQVIKKEFKNSAERILFGQTMNKLRGEHDKKIDIEVVYSLVHENEDQLNEYMRLMAVEDERQIFDYLHKSHPDFALGGRGPELDEVLEEILDPLKFGDSMVNEQEIITREKEIWKLGNHYLMCGDCTNQNDVKMLLKDKTVDLLLTDPPYGVNYVTSHGHFIDSLGITGLSVQKDINNDNLNLEQYKDFFSSFLKNVPFSDYNIFYIFMSHTVLHLLRQAIDDNGLTCANYLVWIKNAHNFSAKDYNQRHEFIAYGWKDHHKFYGPFSTTVLEYDRPHKADLHPVMKPVELLEKLVTDGSKKDMIVYDPFMGSGSTIIACEKTGRSCYGMEINRKYCDVICERFQSYTKTEPVRITDGKTYGALKRERQKQMNIDRDKRQEPEVEEV